MNCQRHNVNKVLEQARLNKDNWIPRGINFNEVNIHELVRMNPVTGHLEPRGISCILLTGTDSLDGVKVTCRIHYDTSTGVYTVLSHETEEV